MPPKSPDAGPDGASGATRGPGGAPAPSAENAAVPKAGGAKAVAASGAASGAGKVGAAAGHLDTAAAAKKLKDNPNLTNALDAAGTVSPEAKAAATALKTGKKAKELVAPDTSANVERLGAGGTSAGPRTMGEQGAVPRGDGLGAGGKTAMAAGAGAGVAASPLVMFLMFLNWLKTLFMAALQAVLGWFSVLIAMISNAVMGVVGFFAGIGGAVAGFFGGTLSAGASVVTGIGGAVGSFFLAGAMVFGLVSGGETARRDAQVLSCAKQVELALNTTDVTGTASDAQVRAMAMRIYAILSGMGMSDTNIAGILGNWTAESRIDPTIVETIFDEPFFIGPRKQAAQAVDFRIDDFNPAYAAEYPAIEYAGIGLGQWTNQRNRLLLEYANSRSLNWYNVDTQLGFMISTDDPVRVQYIKQLIATPAASVDQATADFMTKWEGLSLGVGNLGVRQAAAAQWFSEMTNWEADVDLANSILQQAGATTGGATNVSLSNSVGSCRTADVGVSDNSSLAMAALSYAYPTTELGRNNNGTPLYQEVHDYVFPGDPYYMSCDRGVATAVRWSGTDDTYPAGNVFAQLMYVTASPKWTEISWGGDPANLQPGDVLMRADGSVEHTVLYVGSELVQQVFAAAAAPNAVTVSASFGTRSPGAGAWYTGSEGLNTYRAFRSTGPEVASIYVGFHPTQPGWQP